MDGGDHVDLLAILDAYRQQVPQYKALAELVEGRLTAAAKSAGVHAIVSGRPKEPANLVLKLLQKIADKPDEYLPDPLSKVVDRAGARVVVAHKDDVWRMLNAIRAAFVVVDEDDKASKIQPNELGYTGYHVQVRLLADDSIDSDLHELECEVQIHTIAQSAWSNVSHPLVYKPAGQTVDRAVEARVYRSVALVSLFDDEVMAARRQVHADPAYVPSRMLDTVTKHALAWMLPDPSMSEVSLQVLSTLVDAYTPDELERFDDLISSFMEAHAEELATLQNQQSDIASERGLLYGPEVVAIFERMVTAPLLLRAVWIESSLPIELLDETAAGLGRPYVVDS